MHFISFHFPKYANFIKLNSTTLQEIFKKICYLQKCLFFQYYVNLFQMEREERLLYKEQNLTNYNSLLHFCICKPDFTLKMFFFLEIKLLTSVWVQTQKNFLCLILPQFSCFFILFSAFLHKALKKQILTSVWSAQHQKHWSEYRTTIFGGFEN